MNDSQIARALEALPLWKQLPLRRADVFNAAREFKPLRYDEDTTFAQWEDGTVRGHTNCFGLLFLVVIRLGLMEDRAFWRAWNAGVSLVGVPLLLRAYLGREMRSIEPESLDAGDVLLFRWRALSPRSEGEEAAVRRGRHHVGIVAPWDYPRSALASPNVIQATDTGPNSGGVFESPLATHDGDQILRAATFPQFCGS